MCDCTSCKYTDGFAKKGFDAWPRGKIAGATSAKDYSAHVAHAMRKTWGVTASRLSLGTHHGDPHATYVFPTFLDHETGDQLYPPSAVLQRWAKGRDTYPQGRTPKEYVALFLKHNGLTSGVYNFGKVDL